MARETGELVDWNDDRGFGFINGENRQRLFVHISAIESHAYRPVIGDRVSFERGPGRDGKPAALQVRITGASGAALARRARQTPDRRPADIRLIITAILLLVLVAATILGRLPLWIAGLYPLMGLLSAGLYGFDKARAQNNGWRISEASLHLVDLFGGIAGGLLAQQVFRHKTAKPSFALVSFATAGLHALVLLALCLGLLGGDDFAALLKAVTA